MIFHEPERAGGIVCMKGKRTKSRRATGVKKLKMIFLKVVMAFFFMIFNFI